MRPRLIWSKALSIGTCWSWLPDAMLTAKQIVFLLCWLGTIVLVLSRPDGGDSPPLPGPGLSYGGIPYGSMSGNVAEFFRTAAPIKRRANHDLGHNVDFTPIEQWL